jgi:hypothetical protein
MDNTNQQIQEEIQQDIAEKRPDETSGILLQGHLKIYDPESKEVFLDKRNAIHYENFSLALAKSISNAGQGWISEMCFGNGGTRVDPTGIITYLTPNTAGLSANLYNQTYIKNIDAMSTDDLDPARNYMDVRHITGTAYTDVLVSCLLDFGEPQGQLAFDNATQLNSNFVFDEIGLRGYSNNGAGTGDLLTHVIFHPVQKSLNRMLQIDYTVRIQALTSITG